VEGVGVAVEDDEDVGAFPGEGVFQATHGAAAFAIDRAGPVLARFEAVALRDAALGPAFGVGVAVDVGEFCWIVGHGG